MSWFWGNTKSKAASAPTESTAAAPPDQVLSASTSDFTSETTIPSKPLSREEQANQDLAELLREFQLESEQAKDGRIQAKEGGTANTVPIPEDISPDSLYPTELSCRSSLDYAMFCQSLGGQFVNVYRYGQFRSCSNHWGDFWLCMRTRNWDEKDKKKAIQDHHRQKAIKWKTGPSSEDIWEVRNEPVKDAFQDNLEELEARITEWKKANPTVPDPWAKQSGSTFSSNQSSSAP